MSVAVIHPRHGRHRGVGLDGWMGPRWGGGGEAGANKQAINMRMPILGTLRLWPVAVAGADAGTHSQDMNK